MTMLSTFYRFICTSGRIWLVLFLGILLWGITKPIHAQHSSMDTEEVVKDSLLLAQHVRQALENNPRIEALFQQYYARLEQIPQVGALPDPEIMFQYHINPMEYSNPFSRTTISAMQMFPWFGTLGKRREYVEKVARVEWTNFQQARNEVVRQVKEQWYQMHEMNHHLKIFKRNLDLLGSLERQVRARYESGRVSQVDLLRIQIEQESLQTQIENTRQDLEAMKVRFNTLLNRQTDATVELPEHIYVVQPDISRENLLRTILRQNPELRAREFEEEAARIAEQQARLEGLPSFGLGVMVMNKNYMYMPLMSGDRAAWTGSLTIRVPLYRSKYRAQQQEARLEARAARAEQRNVANRLNAQAEELLQQYQDARNRIALYEKQLIPKILQALDIAMDEYSSGRSGFEQIIQLQQQLLDYEMRLHTAYAEQNIAIAEIEYLYGEYNVNPEETDK